MAAALSAGIAVYASAPAHAAVSIAWTTLAEWNWSGNVISSCGHDGFGSFYCHISAHGVMADCPYSSVTTYGCSVAFDGNVSGTWGPANALCGSETIAASGTGVVMVQEGPTWYGGTVSVGANSGSWWMSGETSLPVLGGVAGPFDQHWWGQGGYQPCGGLPGTVPQDAWAGDFFMDGPQVNGLPIPDPNKCGEVC